MNFLNNLNLNKNQIQNALMHPLAAAPASPKESQMYYNTVDKKLYYYDGAKWIGLNDIDLTPYATKQYVDDKFTDEVGDGVLTLQLNGTALTPTFTANQKGPSTINVQVTKSTVGLGNVDNTSDAAKPVSTAQQTALDKKLDKVETPGNERVYTIGTTGNQTTTVITSAPTEQTIVKRTGNGQIKAADGVDDNDVATVGQIKASSTYYVELTTAEGTITADQYNKLKADNNSYILYKTAGQTFRLARTSTSTNGTLTYQKLEDTTDRIITIQSTGAYAYSWTSLEDTANQTTVVDDASTNEQYPTAQAVYSYGQTVLTNAKSYTDTATENVEKTTNKKTTIEGNGNATDYPSTSAVVGYAAPIAHAVAGTTYGAGTTEVYGHVKLITGDMNGKAYAAGQVPSLNHTHGQYAELAGAAFTGNVTIGGNLTVNGTTTTIESSTLQVKDKLIEVAHGNTTALTTPAGLIVPKYDGTNSGALVFDSTGTAYVGDVTLDTEGNINVANSDLRALAARDGTIANGNITKWDNTKQALVDAGIASSNIALKSEIPTEQDYVTIDTTQTITGAKTFGANVVLSKGLYVGDTPSAGSANQVLTSRSDGKSPEWKNVSTILPNNVVTTDDAQNITGAKTFKGEIAVDNHIRANGGVGTAGQVLTSQGVDKAPQWTTLTIPQGTVKKFTGLITGNGTSASFNITNQLSTVDCTVSIYSQVNGTTWEMVMTDVSVSVDSITITFGQAVATGKSYKVVVTG